MRFFLVSDNVDTGTGMRLAGIKGVVVHTRKEVSSAIDAAVADREVAVLLITEKLAALCPQRLHEIKSKLRYPLVVEIPDRHGSGRSPDSIIRYVRDAIGVKL